METNVEIKTADGTADGILFQPDSKGAFPGVIHLTDVGGIRQSHRDMAQRLTSQGYAVLMPNVFYRTGKPPVFDSPFKMGEEKSMKRLAELTGPLTPEAVARDASPYVDFLSNHESVSRGTVGVVGYCFTGAMALRIAAAHPDRIAAAASFHGGSLCTDAPTSPHLLLPQVKARLYFGHAFEDRSMPQEASTSSTARSKRGEANTRAKYTKALVTAGRCRRAVTRPTTSPKPNAPSANSAHSSRKLSSSGNYDSGGGM
jgi:carboxymethylenebutenolidase